METKSRKQKQQDLEKRIADLEKEFHEFLEGHDSFMDRVIKGLERISVLVKEKFGN